jgi:hypothetical protein
MSDERQKMLDAACFNIREADRQEFPWATVAVHSDGVSVSAGITVEMDHRVAVPMAYALIELAQEMLKKCWAGSPIGSEDDDG